MSAVTSNSREHRYGKAVGLLVALALTTLATVFSAGPAAATDWCGTPDTSGGYSVTACTGYDQNGQSYGYLYVTLPAGHANCTIHGKVIYYDNPPQGYPEDWACPAGAITNARYDIDFVPNGSTYTHASVWTSNGATVVFSSS